MRLDEESEGGAKTAPTDSPNQNASEPTTSPSARVPRAWKTRGASVSLMNRTEPSQSRNWQPPGCRLQKPSAPAPGAFGVFPPGMLPLMMSVEGPVLPMSRNMSPTHDWVGQPALVQRGAGDEWLPKTPGQAASARLRERSPIIKVAL